MGHAKCFITCLGFELGACIYLAAFTTESCQLVKLPTGLGHVFTWAGDYDQTDGREIMYGKELIKNEGAKIRPGPIDIPRVILSTLAQEHMGPALFLGLIHQLTHNTL